MTTITHQFVETAAASVRVLAAAAVAHALETEGRVGMSLSGGIDSSSVYALAGDRSIPCFTGYYEGDAYDERFFARQVAGDVHHEILITPEDFVAHFDDMVLAAKPPYQGPGTFGQYMVARYASAHVDRMLSGEGGDELFGGYARLLIAAGEQPPEGYEDYVLPSDYPRASDFASREDHLQAALAWDFDRLGDLLAVDDQMLAAFGIEARAPFTEQAMVEFVLACPPELRIGKRLLKLAMRGTVPDVILDRTGKMGFPVPFVTWANEISEVGAFIENRIGYIPHPDQPWSRDWWVELCERRSAELLGL